MSNHQSYSLLLFHSHYFIWLEDLELKALLAVGMGSSIGLLLFVLLIEHILYQHQAFGLKEVVKFLQIEVFTRKKVRRPYFRMSHCQCSFVPPLIYYIII